jgi:hypothetical protein
VVTDRRRGSFVCLAFTIFCATIAICYLPVLRCPARCTGTVDGGTAVRQEAPTDRLRLTSRATRIEAGYGQDHSPIAGHGVGAGAV